MQNYQNKTAREDMRAQGARAGLENRRRKESEVREKCGHKQLKLFGSFHFFSLKRDDLRESKERVEREKERREWSERKKGESGERQG